MERMLEIMKRHSEEEMPGGKAFEAHEYLRQVRHSYLRTQVLCERAQRYRDMALRATGRVDALRVSGTPRRSNVDTYVMELVDTHNELKKEISELMQESRRAEKIIASLADERYHAVLQFRYLCGMSWEEIAEKLHFTLRWVHKLHSEAMAELNKKYRP